jgi:hypothetical protein
VRCRRERVEPPDRQTRGEWDVEERGLGHQTDRQGESEMSKREG